MDNIVKPVSVWCLDKPHSRISFRIRHMMISWISGYFQEFDGNVSFETADYHSFKADLTIKVDSISTGNSDRDEHLKSIDFFDAGLFPEIRFSSDKMLKTSDGKLKLPGELSIHGHQRDVVLEVEDSGSGLDPWGNERAGFSFSCTINRRDFGISWNTALESGGVLIGEEVHIRAELQLIRKPAS